MRAGMDGRGCIVSVGPHVLFSVHGERDDGASISGGEHSSIGDSWLWLDLPPSACSHGAVNESIRLAAHVTSEVPPSLRGKFPFRTGFTSYVYPADLLPNARVLCALADDVEIVLFESEPTAPLPGEAVVRELATLAARYGTTYTVHLPIDGRLGSADPTVSDEACAQIARIIARMGPLEPWGYVLHPDGIDESASAAEVKDWQQRMRTALERILAHLSSARLLCLENLDYPFEWCVPLLSKLDCAVCMDVGHLWLRGEDWKGHRMRYGERIRIVHLHGMAGGRDHLGLGVMKREVLSGILDGLADYSGVLTLEVFGVEPACESARILLACGKGAMA